MAFRIFLYCSSTVVSLITVALKIVLVLSSISGV